MLTSDDPLPRRPRRILIAGVSGCGKTTLAGHIARIMGAPHTEIDALFHGPNWTPRPEFFRDVQAMIEGESWTTEWQYDLARPLLAQHADLLVWLDLPFWSITFPRVLRRTISRRWHRTVLWNGNVEPPLRTAFTDPDHLLRWVMRSRHKYPERVLTLEQQLPHLMLIRLRSRREVRRWLLGPLHESAESEPGFSWSTAPARPSREPATTLRRLVSCKHQMCPQVMNRAPVTAERDRSL